MLKDDIFVGAIDNNPDSLLAFKIGSDGVINDSSLFVEEHGKIALCDAWLALSDSASHCCPLQQFKTVASCNE